MTEARYQMEKDANVVGNSYVYRYYMTFNRKTVVSMNSDPLG